MLSLIPVSYPGKTCTEVQEAFDTDHNMYHTSRESQVQSSSKHWNGSWLTLEDCGTTCSTVLRTSPSPSCCTWEKEKTYFFNLVINSLKSKLACDRLHTCTIYKSWNLLELLSNRRDRVDRSQHVAYTHVSAGCRKCAIISKYNILVNQCPFHGVRIHHIWWADTHLFA